MSKVKIVKKEILIGSDHAGFVLKEKVKEWLLNKGYLVHDVGAHFLKKDDDYPIIAENLARDVIKRKIIGILLCGTGEGACIAANKVRGIRAITAYNQKTAKFGREHNDANILCLSGWWLNEKDACKIIDTWINSRFSGAERHIRRIKEIENIGRDI